MFWRPQNWGVVVVVECWGPFKVSLASTQKPWRTECQTSLGYYVYGNKARELQRRPACLGLLTGDTSDPFLVALGRDREGGIWETEKGMACWVKASQGDLGNLGRMILALMIRNIWSLSEGRIAQPKLKLSQIEGWENSKLLVSWAISVCSSSPY